MWVGSTFVFGEVGVAFSEIREGDEACWGEVMTMTPVCDVDETLYVRCVVLSVPLRGLWRFSPDFAFINWATLFYFINETRQSFCFRFKKNIYVLAEGGLQKRRQKDLYMAGVHPKKV